MLKYSNYNYLVFENCKYYVYNSLSKSLLKVSKKLYEKLSILDKGIQGIDELNFHKEDLSIFTNSKIFIETNEERKIINNIKLDNFLLRYDKSQLSLTIAPTTHCNFKCIYCYEEHIEGKNMTTIVEDKIVDFIKSKPEVKFLNITWFGGEPLLSLSKIESITKKILLLDINYNASIITNGYYLNEKLIKKLKVLKVSFLQITIDGLEATHNKRRPVKKGGNSFNNIIENLSILMKIEPEIKVNIRINIDKSNEHEFPELYAFLKEKFGNKYFITPAFVVSESTNYSECLPYRIDKSKFELTNKFLPISSFYPLNRPLECMARRINAYLIDPEGNLYKCYEDIGKEEKKIGNLNSRGLNTILMTDYLVGEDPFSDDECLNCKLFPLCNGGCPYLRLNKKENKDYCITMKGFERDFILAHIYQKDELVIK